MTNCRIAKLDKRIGNCTVMAYHKWQPIFSECESSLGFSGDAANDVYSAWSRLAADAFKKRNSYCDRVTSSPLEKPRRSNSLTRLHGRKTVKVPVQLIPLERARALTAGRLFKDEPKMEQHRTRNCNSSTVETSPDEKPEISRPINIEESNLCCSYPSAISYRISLNPYAPQADFSSTSPNNGWLNEQGQSQSGIERQESKQESSIYAEDPGSTIQSYVDKVKRHREERGAWVGG